MDQGHVARQAFLERFDAPKGQAIWDALQSARWIAPRGDGSAAEIRRCEGYGWDRFTGPLAPFSDDETKRQVLELLDQRVVLIVFGDNANLSASVAKAIGALLRSDAADEPDVAAARRELEAFLDDQEAGYARLYDADAGQFFFGWDQTHGRHFGWEESAMQYLDTYQRASLPGL